MIQTTIEIAIADDHPLFCEGLRLVLESKENFKMVLEAKNGQELLNGISTLEKQPQVVLLDLRMPVKDGIETTKELKVKYPDIKILILTMIDQEDYITHLLDIGANGYLLKNSSTIEIQEAIEKVVKAGFYFNDFVSNVMLKTLKRKKSPTLTVNGGEKISLREIEVCELLAAGHTTQEIGEKLFISPRTVETHRKHLMEKLDAKNTAGIIYHAFKKGLIH